MGKILFVNGNVQGHINPTLALVRELVARGEEVVYWATEEFRSPIEAAGASFEPYGEPLNRFLASYRPTGDHPFYTLLEFLLKMDEQIVPLVTEKIAGASFDCLVHDAMFGGGRVLAKRLGLPAVCSCTSFAMNRLPVPPAMTEPGFHPQLDRLYEEMERAAAAWELDSFTLMDLLFKQEDLTVVYTSRLFQPDSDAYDDRFAFVGPSLDRNLDPGDFPLHELEGKRVLYISMGTIHNGDAAFYRTCIEAFGDWEGKVVLSVGNKVDLALLGEIPGNFIVRRTVPQLAVLQKADAFVSHGGLNSVSEALFCGVPIVAIPQMNDQPAVTKQLVGLGAGIGLKPGDATAQALRDSVQDVLREDRYRKAAAAIRASFREAGGYQAAADRILAYVESAKRSRG
ncbi:macrolide family glycosyltransferase [Gorillibacterium sp. sgz500922]|uniref:macrolide family glycosyltransferase n=1 Tax=Gorillibacterium sp. sgz500922 TaxID=3446694 RepID=UPI003F677604